MKIKFTLNGQIIEAEAGQTVIDAATDAGIPIPSICHHRSLVPEGSCRLCGVEVEGRRGEIASCTLPAVEGMVVRSETPAIKETRLQVLGLLLQDYHDAGYNPDDPETEFMYWVRRSGLSLPRDRASLSDQQRSQPLRLDGHEQMHPVHSLCARM